MPPCCCCHTHLSILVLHEIFVIFSPLLPLFVEHTKKNSCLKTKTYSIDDLLTMSYGSPYVPTITPVSFGDNQHILHLVFAAIFRLHFSSGLRAALPRIPCSCAARCTDSTSRSQQAAAYDHTYEQKVLYHIRIRNELIHTTVCLIYCASGTQRYAFAYKCKGCAMWNLKIINFVDQGSCQL